MAKGEDRFVDKLLKEGVPSEEKKTKKIQINVTPTQYENFDEISKMFQKSKQDLAFKVLIESGLLDKINK